MDDCSDSARNACARAVGVLPRANPECVPHHAALSWRRAEASRSTFSRALRSPAAHHMVYHLAWDVPIQLQGSTSALAAIILVICVHAQLIRCPSPVVNRLAYLCVASKYASEASGLSISTGERIEHARATNNATAFVALVSLSCFMRGFKLSYSQCSFVGLLLLISTVVAWCLQPPSLPLGAQSAAMWTNLSWVVAAIVTEVMLLRAAEVMCEMHGRDIIELSHA